MQLSASALISRSTIMTTSAYSRKHWVQKRLGKRVHLGLICKFDCLFNPSLMDYLTQLMALFVFYYNIRFFSFFYFMHEIIFTD